MFRRFSVTLCLLAAASFLALGPLNLLEEFLMRMVIYPMEEWQPYVFKWSSVAHLEVVGVPSFEFIILDPLEVFRESLIARTS